MKFTTNEPNKTSTPRRREPTLSAETGAAPDWERPDLIPNAATDTAEEKRAVPVFYI